MEFDMKNWPRFALSVGLKSAGHPIEYARILMQIGFEPIAPKETRTLFGKPALALPNIFQYIGYVRRKQGFFGLYRGNTSRVCGVFACNIVFDKFQKKFSLEEERNGFDQNTLTEEEKVIFFIKRTARDMMAQCAAVLVSHPFQVITVRTVAQFVGGEDTYKGFFSSLAEIYKQDGVCGYFAGLVPRLLGEILALWLSGCLTFVINTYMIRDDDLKLYTEASMSFLASAVTYPFILVSKIMIVSGSSLQAGRPPITPIYSSWTDCWSNLKSQNQLKRGSSMLWRYHQEPEPVILSPHIASPRDFKSPTLKKYM